MDEIGVKVTLQLEQRMSVTKEAVRFELLALRISPPEHLVEAEVALFDEAGKVIGPARWVRVNPLPADPPDIEPLDNWAAVLEANFAGLKEMVKKQLKELS